ncbi:arylesterase [Massilia psychrophila]|uniref:Arylesterase n=1 Tax=Massilia psychrophila TaxID=1603353 RepID=A0A2G8T2J8_9BURK|nr:arylesterase [Massilia psychrophila]PIL40239.1 arylesterase [Massilia psychrophila]GGE76140.1 arylesterase [Massilia psychrophila]
MLAFLTRYLGSTIFGAVLMLAATIVHSAPKTVLVLGDSLSAEYGLTRGSGWVALLDQKLKTEKINAAIVNASISGETTSGGRSRLPALIQQHRPALVVIELGANDGLRGLPVAAAEANLRAMVELAQKNDAEVLLVGMRMPPNYGRAYTEQFFSMYKTLSAQLKAPLVPFMLEGVAEKPALFQADRLHPTAQAHPIILANIWPKFLPLVKAR